MLRRKINPVMTVGPEPPGQLSESLNLVIETPNHVTALIFVPNRVVSPNICG